MVKESKTKRIGNLIEIIRKSLDDDLSSGVKTSAKNDEIDMLADLVNRLIDKKTNTESALRKNEEKYLRLKANIPENVYLSALHPDGSFSFPYISEASRKLFNTPPEDLMADATLFTRLIHPDDRERFKSSIKHSAETLQSWREVLRFIVNGEVHWYDSMSSPHLQPNGDILWDGITLEITDHMKLMEQLRESEHQLSEIISTSPIGIAIYDDHGQCIAANDSIAQIISATKEQMLKQNYSEIEAWKESGLLDMVRKAVGTQSAERHEVTVTSIFGRNVFIDCHLVPFGAKGLLFMAQDITDRKRAEEALRDSNRSLDDIIDFLPDATFVIDRNGKVIAWNRAIEQMTKVAKADMIGKENYEYAIPFYGQARPLLIDLTMMRDDDFEGKHYEGVYRQGDMLYAEAYVPGTYGGKGASLWGTASRLCDASGNIVGAIESIRDITDRKRAEEALAKSYALMKGVIESPKNVVIFALDHQYRYIAFNKNHHQTMKQIWGVDITLGNSMLEYIKNPGDRQKAKLNFDRALSGESFMIIEEYGDTMLERRCYEDIYNPIIDETGHIIGLTLFLTDITERKRAEEEREKLKAQLSQAQKMESVGRLAGGVAHDFNNMLSVIIGYTELAMNQLGSDDPLFASMQQIRKAAGRSAELTRQLLAFARKQTVSPIVLNLNESVESMLKMLRRLIGEDIDLAWLPSAKIWQVNIDPSQIDQILANLCVNARDAISGIGRITIETHTIKIDGTYCPGHPDAVPGEYVVLAVSDNGAGMDEETLNNLFEPFFTTKEIGKGTGLGLATVYGIVKQNNGFINVYSKQGHGTTFKIYLPRHSSEKRQIQKEAPAVPTSPGNETILLVEDETSLLDMERLMLEGLGYRVLTASTPREALLTSREFIGEIQLLITDVIMPEMNGRELVNKLVSSRPGVKLLFMSGYTDDVIAHHGLLEEGVYFIQKPFSAQGLAAKVREVLDGK
jgi:two-component system, cell cycle sensor histidine kinase and response regulator CckA